MRGRKQACTTGHIDLGEIPMRQATNLTGAMHHCIDAVDQLGQPIRTRQIATHGNRAHGTDSAGRLRRTRQGLDPMPGGA